ncbi:hypothetical protein AB0B89_29790 [Sphaerisporangium sp. NPDC049002]|uniref:hypothetical protein n=1 Tax=Sphaerisporangium sp. NPDC049002 TaxID=3155392 RepID=UPI0033E264CF
MTVYLTIFCTPLLAGLVLLAPLPFWTSLVLALVLVTAAVLLLRAVARRMRSSAPLRYLPVTLSERQERRVVDVVLPSGWDDYDFRFSATVYWCPDGAPATRSIVNPGALAVEAILQRARAITERRQPGRASLVQHELNGALGRMQPEASGCLQVMAKSVTLVLSENDQARLDKLATMRKEKAVWEHERKQEQSRRDYLGNDVLKDTGSAVVWWLARNEDQVEKTVQDIGLLARLSSAANNEDVPELFQHLVPDPAFVAPADTRMQNLRHDGTAGSSGEGEASAADHFDAFLRGMGFPEDDPQRALFSREVAEYAAKYGRPEVAAELVRRFDTPDPPHFDDFDPSSDRPDGEPGF